MNGEHYSMFDQWCDTSSRDLETIQAGLYKYLRHVKGLNYPYDFVYLSATHAPLMYDNSPPNQDLPSLVRQWNEQGRQPRLRLVTSNELLARLRQIPRDQIPVVAGDWTDYWNFGSASSAAETCLSRRMTANTAAIDLLRAWQKPDTHAEGRSSGSGTTSTSTTNTPGVPTTRSMRIIRSWPCNGISRPPRLTTASRSRIFICAANCIAWPATHGNPGRPKVCSWLTLPALRQSYFVPGTWKGSGKQIESHFMGVEREATARPLDGLYGPVQLEPFSPGRSSPGRTWLPPRSDTIATGADFIESDHYKLTFDPATGKVTRPLRQEAATGSGRAGSAVGLLPTGP